MASDWLAAVLPANQMPGLKIFGQLHPGHNTAWIMSMKLIMHGAYISIYCLLISCLMMQGISRHDINHITHIVLS